MIPSDLAARLRFLHEASLFETSPPVAGLQRSRELQNQLQELLPGQRFFATLQRTLPDGTFRALVAGQQVTLALNTSAKPGDTLELVATKVTPGMVLSRIATPADGAGTGSARPTLSQTGQLISFLLTGQPASKPAALAMSQPLFQSPPPPLGNSAAGTNVAAGATANLPAASMAASPAAGAVNLSAASSAISTQLAPLLRQALSQSGLFYESHQAQWLAGKIDVAALLREPQAQGGQPQASPAGTAGSTAASGAAGNLPSASGAGNAASAEVATARAGNTPASQTNAAIQALARHESPVARIRDAASAPAENALRNNPIPERLLPVVHQQLEALASHQYVFHGLAWPGQPFEWVVDDPRDEGYAEGEEADEQWKTTLRLTLPRLGGVEARIQLGAKGVALRLQVDGKTAAVTLGSRRGELAQALEAAGVPLTGMVVEPRNEP
ncbi:MAG: flagellar hook-length control protein FliK [Azoarcus sp.]|jgi:hypothetical protein|nr:flagellar hook-length control protein FliK [Azoarcus sp.]